MKMQTSLTKTSKRKLFLFSGKGILFSKLLEFLTWFLMCLNVEVENKVDIQPFLKIMAKLILLPNLQIVPSCQSNKSLKNLEPNPRMK